MSIDPTLADAIGGLSDGAYWAYAVDDQWRTVAVTDELAAVSSQILMGVFAFGPEARELIFRSSQGLNSVEDSRAFLRRLGNWMLSDLAVDRDTLREMLHPELRETVDELEPTDVDVKAWETPSLYFGGKINVHSLAQRVRDSTGRVVGTLLTTKPAVGTTMVAMMTAAGDQAHLERMWQLASAERRPAAVLFADLEGSTQLAKRLPTATYLTLVRRLTRAADQAVIDVGGLVGRHAGDGVAAFFAAETAGSESAAARACITVARALQEATRDIAVRHGLRNEDVTVRAGLHWGATLHIGSIVTPGRTEVTALGDEVNDAARIEACATGGRVLASKTLIERLNIDDAAALDIDPNHLTYIQLADLDTATEKARRDAPAIAVCDLVGPAS